MIPVVPAVIPESAAQAVKQLAALSFTKEVHVDVVDGVFAGQPSWPYQPAGRPQDIQRQTDVFTVEVDLMTVSPIMAATDWVLAGADMVVFHIETVSLDAFKTFVAHTPASVGVSMHGNTTLDELCAYAEYADYIQLMGIRQIGAMGQPFDDRVLQTIRAVKQVFPHTLISVDGSVNSHTIRQLCDAGAQRVVVGSAIIRQADPQAAWAALTQLVK